MQTRNNLRRSNHKFLPSLNLKMKLLKKSFKEFRKRMYKLAIPQLLLFFTSLLFLVFGKSKLGDYIKNIKDFEPRLNELIQTANATDPASIAQITTFVEATNQVINQAVVFGLILIPIVLLIFWVIFQGIFWKSLKPKIENLKSYFIKFTIPTAILLFIIVFAFSKQITPAEFFQTIDSIVLKSVIFLFFSLYFLTIYYSVLSDQKFNKTINKTFSLAIKKAHKLIPLFIPLFLSSMILLTLFIISLTQQSISAYVFIEAIPLAIAIIIILAFSTFYKILFQKYIEKIN
jgi:hypothetical protein